MRLRQSAKHLFYSSASVVLLMLAGCLTPSGQESVQTPGDDPGIGNSAPAIRGTPASGVTIGHVYTFVPTVSDPEGDQLSFSIRNMPGWATFDTTTGELAGQPSLGSEGTYSNIEISVSDGTSTVSMSTFSITVTQTSLGNATLSLTAPALNTDGTPFTDLASFRIYFGMTPGQYSNEIHVSNPGISTYVVENLAPSTYYFVATVVNQSGLESGYSNEVARVVE